MILHTLDIKRTLMWLLLCLVPALAQAQIGEARHNICIGVSGGMTMNRIGFDPTIKQSWHYGPTFGVVARFTSERYFKAFCACLLYTSDAADD